MALLDSEITRIRAELGYNVMGLAALPYMGITAIFDSVIQAYIKAGAVTSSGSPVSASLLPLPQSLVLLSAVGFHVGDRIVVDVDSRQEVVTVQNLVGSTTTALLSKAHSGTYPVTVEGGESIVRGYLQQVLLINGPGGTLERLRSRVGIAKVDEIEFFGGAAGAASAGKDPMSQVMQLLDYWRDMLASSLGVENRNSMRGSQSCEIY